MPAQRRSSFISEYIFICIGKNALVQIATNE